MVQSEDDGLPQFSLKLDDDFPCGAAYRAIRSPRTNSSSDLKRFQHSDSESSLGSASSSDQNAEPGDNSSNQASAAVPLAPAATATSTTEQDLAKRAQRRVIDHKRSELEKKHELEKVRQVKLESDKLKRERASQLKLRRRAEIYALNAIMRQVQQDKIAKFLADAQKQKLAREGANGSTAAAADLPSTHMVHSIGV